MQPSPWMPVVYAAPPFDEISAFGIAAIALGMAAIVIWIWRRFLPATAAKAALALTAWIGITGALAASGLLARTDVRPPPPAVLIASVLTLAIAVGLSRAGGALAASVPLGVLVTLQAFRLPLELVMHHAGDVGIMPPELSYGGYNFDILTGLGALGSGVAMRAGVAVPRGIVWVWNIWGLWCLGVIAVIAAASSPIVRAFGDDPRHVNTWVLHLPYVWLPAVLVLIALAGHVVITRALLLHRRA